MVDVLSCKATYLTSKQPDMGFHLVHRNNVSQANSKVLSDDLVHSNLGLIHLVHVNYSISIIHALESHLFSSGTYCIIS
jgi:hypothetical protein